MIKEQLAQQADSSQFTTSQVPNHAHNGIDAPRISQSDIVPNIAYTAVLGFSPGAPYTTLIPIPANATSLSYHGFASNNAGGGSATKRAIISGEAYFAPSYFYNANLNQLPTTSIPLSQVCNSMYIDSGNSSNTRTYTDATHLVAMADETSTDGNPLLSIIINFYQQGYISVTQDAWNSAWQATLAVIIK